jgi:hypothetical protein
MAAAVGRGTQLIGNQSYGDIACCILETAEKATQIITH